MLAGGRRRAPMGRQKRTRNLARGEHRAIRHLGARLDAQHLDDAGVGNIDIDRTLGGLHLRHDLAAAHRSPGRMCHSTRLPRSMSTPGAGMRNSATPERPTHHRHDGRQLRQRGVLGVPGVRDRHSAIPPHPRHRRVEVVRRIPRSRPPHRHAAAAPAIVHHHRAAGLATACEDGRTTPRAWHAQAQYLGRHIFRLPGLPTRPPAVRVPRAIRRPAHATSAARPRRTPPGGEQWPGRDRCRARPDPGAPRAP